MTSSAVAVASTLLPSLSLTWQKRVTCDQVQGAGYPESTVETSTVVLELETSVANLELETDAAALELEMDAAPLELETKMDVSQEISK
jgi:hypothetical protein